MFKKDDLVLAGHVDVDSGTIWIGDPCYILRDEDEERPKDFGKEWYDIVSTFYTRSGYYSSSDEYNEYIHTKSLYVWNKIRTIPDSLPDDIDTLTKKYETEFEELFPFKATVKDKAFAVFNHSHGNEGMGIMMNTNFGDGSYPVYILYDSSGRPKQAIIDFVYELSDD